MSGVEIPGMEPRHVFQLQQTMLGAMRHYDEVSVATMAASPNASHTTRGQPPGIQPTRTLSALSFVSIRMNTRSTRLPTSATKTSARRRDEHTVPSNWLTAPIPTRNTEQTKSDKIHPASLQQALDGLGLSFGDPLVDSMMVMCQVSCVRC